MAARADTRAFCSPSGWLNLQGAKFKYLRDKVHIINSLKLIQEIEQYWKTENVDNFDNTISNLLILNCLDKKVETEAVFLQNLKN